jgi:hypothetical protein
MERLVVSKVADHPRSGVEEGMIWLIGAYAVLVLVFIARSIKLLWRRP